MIKKADGPGNQSDSAHHEKHSLTVSLSPEDWETIDQAAASEGLSRSAFIREAAIHRAITVLALDHPVHKPAKRSS